MNVAWWRLSVVAAGLFPLGSMFRRRHRNHARALAHPLRVRIISLVGQRPGTSISELCAQLGSDWGTMHHHLRILERAELIRGVFEGRTHRYFLAAVPSEVAARIALLRRRRILTLVREVLRNPGLVQRDLTQSVGVSRKMLRGYVHLLTRSGLLKEVRAAGNCRYFPTDELRRVADDMDTQESGVKKVENQEVRNPPPNQE